MSISARNAALQCRFEAWEVTGPRSLRLRMPPDNCCDMRAAVEIAEAILPGVKVVATFEGGAESVTYWKENCGEWFARNGHASKSHNKIVNNPPAFITNSAAAQEYCDALSEIMKTHKVCVEDRPLYVATSLANYGRLSGIITECQGSGPHLSMAMTGLGYDSAYRPVIFNGRAFSGRRYYKTALIADAVDRLVAAELPEIPR